MKTARACTADDAANIAPSERARFWGRVDKSGDCWLWTGLKTHGYGSVWLAGRVMRAHRAAVLLAGGVIPPGSVVCHRCDTPACVRPEHLFVSTQRENMADMHAKGRAHFKASTTTTHCAHGHPMDQQNTILRRRDGARLCRACQRASQRKSNQKHRGTARAAARELRRRQKGLK